MREGTRQRLLTINREFYQSFGQAFAETRRRIQPGVARVLMEWAKDGNWLDLGCGSGALAQAWRKRGIKGSYTGLDLSTTLLAEARRLEDAHETELGLQVSFHQANLDAADWMESLPGHRFDGAMAFAVLHHVPGEEARQSLVNQVAGLLKPGGVFIHSQWQFQHSPKLLSRVQPWSGSGVDEDDLDERDTLLDWRHPVIGQEQGRGLRYVHLFTREELVKLAEGAGFKIVAEFESDGAGEKLGLYQVLQKTL